MINRQIRHIVLFFLVINISIPAHAFWGQETLTRLANTVTSYVTDVFARPSEHKAAILIGTVATLGAGAVLVGAWRKATGAEAPLPDKEREQRIAEWHEAEDWKDKSEESRQRYEEEARRRQKLKQFLREEDDRQRQEEEEELQEQELERRQQEDRERAEAQRRENELQKKMEESWLRETYDQWLKDKERPEQEPEQQQQEDREQAEKQRREHENRLQQQQAFEAEQLRLRQEQEASTSQAIKPLPETSTISGQFPPTEEVDFKKLFTEPAPFATRPPSPEVSPQIASSSSGPAQPEAPQVSLRAQAFIESLGSNILDWPELKNDDKAGPEDALRIQAFMNLSLEDQAGVFEVLRFKLNDRQSVTDVPVQECSWWSYLSNLVINLVSSFNDLFKRQSDEDKAALQKKVVEDSFVQLHNAVRQHEYLKLSMGDLKIRHGMTPAKEKMLGELLDTAIAQAEDEKNIDAMGLSASDIQLMEPEARKLNFMVRVLRPRGANGEPVETDQVALFTPVHGTFATSGPYGSGINNAENGPRLMAAAQRRADAEGVTLYVIIPNWNSEFKEFNREEAACYILPLMQHWFNRFKDRVKFIDVMGHSEGNAVIAMMLKGIKDDKSFSKLIGWLSVCPTAGSDYIPIGCRARVTIWSPADALAFIASVTRFNTYRKQEGLKTYGINVGELDSLFMNISLSYDGVPENHVTAKYRASELYDVIFDIAQLFKGHYELSMNVVKPGPRQPQEILISIRRGKESCIKLSPEKEEETERVSRLSEDRYRSLYPANSDWHEKPHDLLNFAWRYPQHGLREKSDGDAEDEQIAKSQSASKIMQKDLYERFQEEAKGRIKYGLDVKAGRIDVPDEVREGLNNLGIKNAADQDAVLIGSFVHHVLTSSDMSRETSRLQSFVKTSPYRDTFIVDLIAFWRAKALMRNAHREDRAETSECAFQVLDSNQSLYDFIQGASNKSDGGSRIVSPALVRGPKIEKSERIGSLYGLPCGADHVILTPLQKDSNGNNIRFYLKLARTESMAQDIVKKGGAALAAARAMFSKPSASQKIQNPYEPVAVKTNVLESFKRLVNVVMKSDVDKSDLINRAEWGGISEIVALMSQLGIDDSGLRKLLSAYDSLLLRIADETVIYARDEVVRVGFEEYLGQLMLNKSDKPERFLKAYAAYRKNAQLFELDKKLADENPSVAKELEDTIPLLGEYLLWRGRLGEQAVQKFGPQYTLNPDDYRDYKEPIEKYLVERKYLMQTQPQTFSSSSSSSSSSSGYSGYESAPVYYPTAASSLPPVSSGSPLQQTLLPWYQQPFLQGQQPPGLR